MICQQGLDLIRQEEGEHLTPYQDPAGVWTVGVGRTGAIDGVPVRDHGPITREQSERLLREDLESAEASVLRLVEVPLTEYQFAALVSFAFNVGAGNLARSTLLRLLNEGDDEGAAREFRKWRRAGGQILPGLLTRRGREEQLFRMVEVRR